VNKSSAVLLQLAVGMAVSLIAVAPDVLQSTGGIPAHLAGRFHVFDRDGDKIRAVQFRAAGIMSPNSLFFGKNDRILVTPGLYEFEPLGAGRAGGVGLLPVPPSQ
jgi:hypothetical protein